MDKNDIIEYVMHTPHNTNRAVLSSMLNQLTEGGGGGSSDFSTANVTFINQYSETAPFYFPFLMVGPNEELVIAPMMLIRSGESVNVDIVLYKDVSYGYTDSRGTITVSGDVVDNDGNLFVTGDGTITIS